MSNNPPQDASRSASNSEEGENEDRIFGDECIKKGKEITRVMFLNVNGLGYSEKSVKSQSMKNLMVRHNVDVMALAETNVHWSKLRRAQTLPHRCRYWFQTSRTVMSYNQHEKRTKSKHQPGGTAVITRGEMALRVNKFEYDKKRMGRWASQTLQGKQGLVTRIVSVYVPTIISKHGHKKVTCQQQRALLSMGITDNVITVFWQDLWQQIDSWLEAGEQLVVAGDWNQDVSKQKFLEEFRKRGLVPSIGSKHGPDLPATHNNGSVAIDEIFCSSSLLVEAAGYLEHGSTLSDHRPIWIDLNKSTVVGTKAKLQPTYAARKLKTNDPRVVKKYLDKLHSELENNDVYNRTMALYNSIKGNVLTEEQQKEFEDLDDIRTEAMMIAEGQCRKLKMGATQWSPELQAIRDKIEYYSLSRRKKKGRNVSSRILYRLSKKTKCYAVDLSIDEIDNKLKDIFKEYWKAKKKSWKLREDFLTGLAEALEKEGKGKKSSIVKQLISTENQRSMFRKLAALNKKN